MEWLWAGGKGQMQPPLESQLPCYLFIVSLSPQPNPLPSRPSVISTCPPPQASQQSSPRTPGGAPKRVPAGFPAMGVSRRVGAMGRWEGGGLAGEARDGGGGVRVYKSRPTALLFNTHFSYELSVKPLIN